MAEKDGAGLIAQVTQLYKALNKRSSEELLGMRLKEFITLGYLRDHPGTTQQDLGDAMLLDPNTVVILLNELERRGYTLRRRDPEDRRRHLVEVTPEGREAIARAEKARESIEEELLGGITAEERATLSRILSRVLEGLARVPA